VAFAEAGISLFFGPAKGALIPRLVGHRHLVTANSLNSLSDNLGRLAGPALGGWLLGMVGLADVVIVDSVSYMVSGALIALVVMPLSSDIQIANAIVNVPVLPVAVLLLAMMGVPVMGWLISASTLLQRSVSNRYRGRVLGTYSTAQALLMLTGMVLASTLGDYLPVSLILNIAGLLLVVSGLASLVLVPRDAVACYRSSENALD